MGQIDDEGLHKQVISIVYGDEDVRGEKSNKLMALFAHHTKAAVLAGQLEQMQIEASAYSDTLNLFRIQNPGCKLPRGLTSGFQKRMAALQAEQLKLTKGTE